MPPEINDPNDVPLRVERHPDDLITSPFNVAKVNYKEIAQGLLLAMQHARSIENAVVAFLPLASPEVAKKFKGIMVHSQAIYADVKNLYEDIAVDSFNH